MTKEANINNIVYAILSTILYDVRENTGRTQLHIHREASIVGIRGVTGGYEEFVMMNHISRDEHRYIMVVEAKRGNIELGLIQCLLSMRDMRNNNAIEVYGFVTNGEYWAMVIYDGKCFRKTPPMVVFFRGIKNNKELWIEEYSIIVDCITAAICASVTN